jgi:outer membrane immunogenic protein
MRKFHIALLATAAAGLVSSANAADLPRSMPAKAPAIYAPAFSWTGFYVGANAGYGWTSGSGTLSVGAGGGPINERSDGFLGGVQAGYNWQTGPVVFGVEADFQGSTARGSVTATPGGATLTGTDKQDWFGTIRGRLGYAFDRSMVYVTGGGLYGDSKLDGTLSTTGAFTSSATFWTYTVGGGFETFFAPNWSAKVEYLYAGTPDKVAVPPGTTSLTGSAHGDIVRGGVNYHF